MVLASSVAATLPRLTPNSHTSFKRLFCRAPENLPDSSRYCPKEILRTFLGPLLPPAQACCAQCLPWNFYKTPSASIRIIFVSKPDGVYKRSVEEERFQPFFRRHTGRRADHLNSTKSSFYQGCVGILGTTQSTSGFEYLRRDTLCAVVGPSC